MFEFRNRFSIRRQAEGGASRWLFRDGLSPRSARLVEDAALQLDTREDRLVALRVFIPPCVVPAPLPVRDRPEMPVDTHFWQFPAMTERVAFERHADLPPPYGVRVHSWPLAAANVVNADRREGLEPGRPLQARSRLASFVGAHMPHYRSQVRLRLREEAGRAPALAPGGVHAPAPGGVHGAADVVFELTDNWHYDAIVHREQVAGERLDEAECSAERAATRRYNELLSDSVFSLCPEGAGPNTLRLWESLAVGAIPVVVVEDWVWPSIPGAGLRWEDAVIILRRDEVAGLFGRLRRMRSEEPERLAAMQAAGRAVYERFEGVGCF